MNGIQITWIGALLIPSILFFCLGFVFSAKSFHKKQKRPYDFRSDFPFELVQDEEPFFLLGRVFFVLWGSFDAAGAFYLVASISNHSSLLSLSVIFAIIALLRDVVLVALFYIPAFRFKAHFLAFVCSCAFTGFLGAVGSIICANVRDIIGAPAILFAILSGVLGLGAILVMINPKLSNWAKLESSVDESGAVTERRPKIFILAFSEWLVLFLGVVLSIVSLIGFVIFDLV